MDEYKLYVVSTIKTISFHDGTLDARFGFVFITAKDGLQARALASEDLPQGWQTTGVELVPSVSEMPEFTPGVIEAQVLADAA